MGADFLILCGAAQCSSEELRWQRAKTIALRTGGPQSNINLRIADITARMAEALGNVERDLLEIAAYVYCADQAATRGGRKSLDYGQRWRRRLRFEIPVREPDLWNSAAVLDQLCATLDFLSDDDYEFAFHRNPQPEPIQRYLEPETGARQVTSVEEVVLFSGGLDSLGGAVQEALIDRRRVALVSHRPVGKIDARQRALVGLIGDRSRKKPFHVPVLVNKAEELGRDYTQRSRAFLYAALAAVVARLFGRRRFRFYENGVMSVNLPICAQVLGSRATRSTHPRVLQGLSALFGALFDCPFQVENPFFWKTKTDVLLDLKLAGHTDLCQHAVSCVHTREITTQHAHCGHCSQCLDRRLAVLAARLAKDDPTEAYRRDVLRDPLEGDDRTLAESYVRTLNEIEAITDAGGFGVRFPELARLYNHLAGSADEVAERVFSLHKRHAFQICAALDRAGREAIPDMRRKKIPPDCLLAIVFPTPKDVPKVLREPTYPERTPAELPVVDPERMVATWGGAECSFPPRRKLLFGLLRQILEHPGRHVSFDTLRKPDGLWGDHDVDDATIRGAVARLKKHLYNHKLDGLAAAIGTMTDQGRGYVFFDPERLPPGTK